jgi:hypothetical protein
MPAARMKALVRHVCLQAAMPVVNTTLGLIERKYDLARAYRDRPTSQLIVMAAGASRRSGRLASSRAVGAAGARLPDTEKVTGSNPVPPTIFRTPRKVLGPFRGPSGRIVDPAIREPPVPSRRSWPILTFLVRLFEPAHHHLLHLRVGDGPRLTAQGSPARI